MKLILACVIATFITNLSAETVKAECSAKATAESTPAKGKRNPFLNKTGGMIQRPGIKQGSIAIINTQSAVSSSNFTGIAKTMERMLHISVPIKDISLADDKSSSYLETFKSSAADFGVIVVENPACDAALTILPEKKLAIVNVAELKKDCPGETFLRARTCKEISRAVLYVGGGASSQSLENLMGPIFKPSDLDKFADDAIPIDVIGRVYKYLPPSGCETRAFVSYRKAVMEGWAPAPTNEYQKAIWDKVHAMPTAPIKIKPETKKIAK